MQHPPDFFSITRATVLSGFSMASDPLTGSLLRTLAASKPAGRFLELGTGTGLSTSWILSGMDNDSVLESVDFDADVLNIAREYLGKDPRLTLILQDGADWVAANKGRQFNYIFADTWHGKYLLLEEVLDMLAPGGLYIVDDMLPQPNWPEGHAAKAESLLALLSTKENLLTTWLEWATGILIATRIPVEWNDD